MTDVRFGSSAPFSLGIEEELLLVDSRSRRLVPVADLLLDAMRLPEELAGREAYAAQLELRTPVCSDVGEAIGALARTRSAAIGAGATPMGAGLHPAGRLGEVELVRGGRWDRVAESMRGLIRRTPEAALHVHVGIPDAETAIKVCNGLRSHLPLLHGLSANSPWWFGYDSGLASARFAIVRAYPSRGLPPTFRDFDDYLATVSAVTAAGELEDYTFIWWDVRPHPRLGTVEVREMDSQASIEDVGALAALVHCLARLEAERSNDSRPPPEAIAQSLFRASRDGLDATIFQDGSLRPLREVAAATIELARPHAVELGAAEALERIDRMLRTGGGADRQRAAAENGGLDAILDLLIEETRAQLA